MTGLSRWNASPSDTKEEMRRAERNGEVAASERRFHAVIDSINQIVWSARPDGSIDFLDRRWHDYTGFPEGSADSAARADVVHPDDRDRARTCWQDCLATGGSYEAEYRLRHWSGIYRWMLGRAVPLRDGQGRITHWFGTCTDVQEIVEAREALAQSHLQLTETAQALAHAEEQLRQSRKMQAVGQLTGGIAHDFNNLLTGIIGNLELLQRRVAAGRSDGVERYAAMAAASAERAAALTQRLLTFARRQPLDPKRVEANRLLSGMEDLLRRALEPEVSLEMALAGALWPTLCDPNQLENAILNLAINARDAMPHGGRLTVETANAHLDAAYADTHGDVRAGQYVAIAVTDTGFGMGPEIVAKAFDPFFTTKPTGQGTGLGLSMLHDFVKQSNGYVRIDSEPGVGTTFRVYLPRCRSEGRDASGAAEGWAAAL